MNAAPGTKDWIFLDLDGCLLRSDQSVSDYTRRVLADVRAQGHRLAIVTARPPRSVRRILPAELHDLWLLCGNGTLTARGPELISQVFLEAQTVERIVSKLIADFPDARYAFEAGDTFATSHDFLDVLPSDPFTVVPGLRTSVHPVNKVLITVPEGRSSRELIAVLPPGLSIGVTDGDTLIQIMPPGVHKGTAVEWLLEAEGQGEGETLCFGDDHVDLPMFQACSWPVALENSLASLKAAARDVTGHHNDDGVARYLEARYLVGAV